jgi:hypothetical protein
MVDAQFGQHEVVAGTLAKKAYYIGIGSGFGTRGGNISGSGSGPIGGMTSGSDPG